MAESHPLTVPGEPAHMDPSVNQRDWKFFLSRAKWFSLAILGITFWLIFVLIGHTPILPTTVILLLAAFVIGKLFH